MKLLVYCGSRAAHDQASITHLHEDSLWGSSLQPLKELPEVGFYKEIKELLSKSQIREIRLAVFYAICFNFMPYHFYNQVRKLIKTFAFLFSYKANFQSLG